MDRILFATNKPPATVLLLKLDIKWTSIFGQTDTFFGKSFLIYYQISIQQLQIIFLENYCQAQPRYSYPVILIHLNDKIMK